MIEGFAAKAIALVGGAAIVLFLLFLMVRNIRQSGRQEEALRQARERQEAADAARRIDHDVERADPDQNREELKRW